MGRAKTASGALTLSCHLYAREGADGQAVVCRLLRGSSPTRGVAPKQPRGLGRAFSPAFRAGGLVLFIPWRVGAEEAGAANFDLLVSAARCCSTGSADFGLLISGPRVNPILSP